MTVTAETTAELRRKRDEVSNADLVELRLDTVSDPNVAGALNGRKVEARGLLYRDGSYADLNLTSLKPLAPDCSK